MEQINWYGHASFSFVDKISGKRIYYVDPFQLPATRLEIGDIVFITHAHQDHFSTADLLKIIKGQTILVGPPDILNKTILQNKKVAVKPNNKYTIDGFSFSTFPAYNTAPERLQFHPKENRWVGYIFELNGQKIYHAGDTDFIPEMKALSAQNLDIAMLPIGGTYTMDWQEAAQAANVIKAQVTIPMHYKTLLKEKARETEEKFKKAVTKSKVVVVLEKVK